MFWQFIYVQPLPRLLASRPYQCMRRKRFDMFDAQLLSVEGTSQSLALCGCQAIGML